MNVIAASRLRRWTHPASLTISSACDARSLASTRETDVGACMARGHLLVRSDPGGVGEGELAVPPHLHRRHDGLIACPLTGATGGASRRPVAWRRPVVPRGSGGSSSPVPTPPSQPMRRFSVLWFPMPTWLRLSRWYEPTECRCRRPSRQGPERRRGRRLRQGVGRGVVVGIGVVVVRGSDG
jgi:hypothetical protein